METVKQIITARGGLDALKEKPIRIENGGYMPLVIEYIGTGPHGLPLISVAHYHEQNGDAMRDPEVVFEVAPETEMDWMPIEYRHDTLGIIRRRAVWQEDGEIYIKPQTLKVLKESAKLWDQDLREQGFLQAATQAAPTVTEFVKK